MSDDAGDDAPLLVQRDGRLGRLVLNRPAAINALTHEMVQIMTAALVAWRDDDAVQTVLVTGTGERGLCAGGDIVAIYHDSLAGGSASAAFWRDEYRLNLMIASYPKPVVAFMDGIVLGGGIGISAHAGTRVVTERSSLGMPETGIGFLPDVGGTLLLSRAPGELGTHLALTAGSVKAADAIAVGLADHHVESDRLAGLAADLAHDDVATAVARAASPAPPSALLEQQGWVDEAYAGDDLATIVERLAARPEEAAAAALKRVRRNSPTALAVTLRALRTEPGDLAEALRLEYRLALRLHAAPDFAEGVRAQVIDKDRNPRWQPATIAEVTPERLDAFFAPLDEPELDLATAGDQAAASDRPADDRPTGDRTTDDRHADDPAPHRPGDGA